MPTNWLGMTWQSQIGLDLGKMGHFRWSNKTGRRLARSRADGGGSGGDDGGSILEDTPASVAPSSPRQPLKKCLRRRISSSSLRFSPPFLLSRPGGRV